MSETGVALLIIGYFCWWMWTNREKPVVETSYEVASRTAPFREGYLAAMMLAAQSTNPYSDPQDHERWRLGHIKGEREYQAQDDLEADTRSS